MYRHLPGTGWENGFPTAYDNGTGYIRIMADLERYGRVKFGFAGGNVNMVIDTESGHRLNITNHDDCGLVHIDQHTPEIGYDIGVYTRDGFDNGDDPIVMVSSHINAAGLADMIGEALYLVAKARA